jgi:hypothetical protein
MGSPDMNRRIGLLAMIAPVWFVGTYLTLSTMTMLVHAGGSIGSFDCFNE